MKTLNFRYCILLPILVLFFSQIILAQSLFTQVGADSTWEYIVKNNLIPWGTNSTQGITGSTINVNNDIVEKCTYGDYPIDQKIRIHTVGNSVILRKDFPKWSRWYQEDGNTQVFRLFKDESNARAGKTVGGARTEAYSEFSWQYGDGWQEWVGTYTVVKPIGAAIFQVKAPGPVDWSLQLGVDGSGNINVSPRGKSSIVVLNNMIGKQFDVRIRDNGLNFEVYINGKLQCSGSYPRQGLASNFRWGFYCGQVASPKADGMLFVTGATINPKPMSTAINKYSNNNYDMKRSGVLTVPQGFLVIPQSFPAAVSITNSSGKIVLSCENVVQPYPVVKNSLANGMYYVRIQTNTHAQTYTIVSVRRR